jgi:hypothetical protein
MIPPIDPCNGWEASAGENREVEFLREQKAKLERKLRKFTQALMRVETKLSKLQAREVRS